jgi:diadenosine tetraphosphate (Ap4A) HIT family hydrolase
MVLRSRKGTLLIRKALKSDEHSECIFCNIDKQPESIVQETKSFFIIKNKYPYTYWDAQDVVDHLMIFPKKHTDTLSDFSAQEAIEYVDIIARYESKGYNLYSRGPHSKYKSVIHQHTHLIKPGFKNTKFIFFQENHT